MAYYVYHVKDDSGKNLYGVINAHGKKDIKKKILGTTSNLFFISAGPLNAKKLFGSRIKFQTLIMFTQRLTSLVEAGIPILTAVNILWKQTEDKNVQMMVSHIRTQLEEGNQISTAMEDFPRIFSPVYRSLVRVGEMSGALVPVLRKLTEYLEYQAHMISRTKRAVMYPAIVIAISLIVVLVMFMFIVPTFEKVLERMNADLPLLTEIIMRISESMRDPFFWAGFIAFIVLTTFIMKSASKTPTFKYHLDNLGLKVPFFGNIMFTLSLSKFIRSLSIMLGSGVSIVESLRISKTTTGNMKISRDVDSVTTRVEQGASLYDSFKEQRDFPVMFVEMIGVGESSGMIVPVLEKVTKHFDEEVDYHLNRFLTALEPALLVFVGGLVIMILLAIFLPVMSIWEKFL